jgi:AcrR family transcriptional regulator
VGDNALEASKGGADQAPPLRRKLSPGPGLAAPQVAAHQLARIHDATIRLVAERGYKDLKVRDIVRLAGVSTRAFYQHFGSKEDCFLQTYQLISRRATRRIIAAQAEEPDWRERPRLIFEEFVCELEKRPDDARLALIEAYAAGEAALARARRAERAFEGMFAEALARPPGGVVAPPLIVQGMVAGLAAVSRNRLLAGRVADLASGGQELLDWAMSYPDRAAVKLADLDARPVWRDTTLEPLAAAANGSGGQSTPSGDRALILAAVAELAAGKGYAGLTAPRIRSAAGVSKRKFAAYFDGVEDCYLAALEQRAGDAMTQGSRAQTAASSRAGGVYRAIAALCDHVAGDPFLARVCLTNDFPLSPNGVRSRQRLIDATAELFAENSPRSTVLATEASTGAVWSLFHCHVIRGRALRHPISATLAYLALAPAVGAAPVIDSIQQEQSPKL